jgi:hypothetical protein
MSHGATLRLTTAEGNLWPARVFVGGIWLLSTLGLLVYVFRYGSNVPFFDDWHMVPYLTGDRPVTLEWLWSQHNDHRVPLSRLLLLGLGKVSGSDFRAGMVFDVLALSATSLVLIATSRGLRGRLSPADAFLPLLLLNPGQWETYLWWWIVSLTLPITMALLVLAIMARGGLRPPAWAVTTAGLLTLAMPLADSAGLAFVPAFVLWFVLVAVAACRAKKGSVVISPKKTPDPFVAFFALVFAIAATGLVIVNYIGYARAAGAPHEPTIPAALRTAIEFLSMGIGQAAVLIWPLSALIVLGMIGAAVNGLGRTWVEQPADRSRVVALVCFLAGAACLAFALGWGRCGEGESAGFKSRYVVMALPVPCAAFLCWSGFRGTWRPAVQSVMCLLMLLLLPFNIKTAIDSAENYRPHFAAFQQDLGDGKSPSLLAERHTTFLFPERGDWSDKLFVRDRLLMLQRAGIGPCCDMAPDLALREKPLAFDPSHLPDVPTEPEDVVAVRIRYSAANPESQPVSLVVRWQAPGDPTLVQAEVVSVPTIFILGPGPFAERTVLAYLDHRIDRLQIEAGDPSIPIAVRGIVLLVKDE